MWEINEYQGEVVIKHDGNVHDVLETDDAQELYKALSSTFGVVMLGDRLRMSEDAKEWLIYRDDKCVGDAKITNQDLIHERLADFCNDDCGCFSRGFAKAQETVTDWYEPHRME